MYGNVPETLARAALAGVAMQFERGVAEGSGLGLTIFSTVADRAACGFCAGLAHLGGQGRGL